MPPNNQPLPSQPLPYQPLPNLFIPTSYLPPRSRLHTYQSRTGKSLSQELSQANDLPKALWNANLACVVMGESPRREAPTSDISEEGGEEGGEDAGGVRADEGAEPPPPPAHVCLYANVAALEAYGLEPSEYKELIGTEATLPATWGSNGKPPPPPTAPPYPPPRFHPLGPPCPPLPPV